ncbi:MAG: cell wall hydrolase [Pseudomonadota bacterium]
MARDRRIGSIRPTLRLLGLGFAIATFSLGQGLFNADMARAEELTLDKPITATWQEIAGAIGATQSAKLQNAYPLRDGAAARVDHGEELHCLALNIYFEARSESDEGRRAVAHVVLNRVQDPKFPSTICQVVQQGGEQVRHRCQFSWWCDGLSDRPANIKAWNAAQALARTIYWGHSQDPTEGAMWYHADYVMPSWGAHFERGPKIGRHIFYRANEERS